MRCRERSPRSIFAIGQAITNAVTEVFGGLTEGGTRPVDGFLKQNASVGGSRSRLPLTRRYAKPPAAAR